MIVIAISRWLKHLSENSSDFSLACLTVTLDKAI